MRIQLMVDNFAITEVNELKNIYITVFRYLYRNVKTKAWERFAYLWFQKETTRKNTKYVNDFFIRNKFILTSLYKLSFL